MNSVTLPVTLRVGTVALLAFSPTVVTNARDHVPVEWSAHGHAPSNPLDGVFRGGSHPAIFVGLGGATSSPGTVVRTGSEAEGIEAVMSRVSELSKLKPGWVGPGSLPPSRDVIEWIRSHASLIPRANHSLIPMEDGSIAIRWTDGELDFTAEMRPGLMLYTLVDDMATDEVQEELTTLTAAKLRQFLDHASKV